MIIWPLSTCIVVPQWYPKAVPFCIQRVGPPPLCQTGLSIQTRYLATPGAVQLMPVMIILSLACAREKPGGLEGPPGGIANISWYKMAIR
jgi:hypothetical protein